MSPSQRSVSCL